MKLIETSFQLDQKYFKTLSNYWKGGTISYNSRDMTKGDGQQMKYRWNSK